MTQEATTEKVREIVAKFLRCKPAKVTPHAHLMEDLGGDSLHMIEIAMGIEDEFEIDITDEEAETMVTLQQLVDHTVKRTGEKAVA